MKKKRLDRDGWGFQGFPYYQVRVDTEQFHGLVGLIYILSGKRQFWRMPKAGKVAVCGKGMFWLSMIPDGQKRVITAKYERKKKKLFGIKYPYSVNVIYCDVIEGFQYDENDLVVTFEDKYLDVIFSTKGDKMIDDRDELDAAYKNGELTTEQYEEAIREGDDIMESLGTDLEKTEAWCNHVLQETIRLTEKIPECRIH